MTKTDYHFDWNDLAFGDKKPLRELKAIFVMAPRELSASRFTQLVKEYLPKGNIVLGIAKEDYIDGFDGQPQFRTLELASVQATIDKANAAKMPHKIYSLEYFQRDVDHVIGKLRFKHLVLVNGSWCYAFHNRSTYYVLANQHIPYDMVSPFSDEAEAQGQATILARDAYKAAGLPSLPSRQTYSEAEMLKLADRTAKLSFDYNFQIGVSLGKKEAGKYRLLTYSHNEIVPYETYAMHHGASRERHFSPPHDLNHYDTVHAEMSTIIEAQRQQFDLHATTLFINLLPCPTCARALSQTDIAEFVYRADHSEGYAIKMLELAGKTVRRVV